MKRNLRKISAVILCAALLCGGAPVRISAGFGIPGTCQVQTDTGACGSAAGTVKTLDYGYANNTYLSLRDMAMILRNTEKSFSLEITKNAVSLNPGGVYVPVGAENTLWEENTPGESGNPDISLKRNEFRVNGQKVSYYTLIMQLPSGYYDCFMTALILTRR